MIKSLILGASRLLFNAGILVAGFGLLLLYLSYRLLRRLTTGAPAQPRREAGFAAMVAIVALVKALQVESPGGPIPFTEASERMEPYVDVEDE